MIGYRGKEYEQFLSYHGGIKWRVIDGLDGKSCLCLNISRISSIFFCPICVETPQSINISNIQEGGEFKEAHI
jgi:hypothetical protein